MNNTEFIFLSMIFCHIIADYNLQGWLANAKCREWWQENASEPMYEYDYIMALIMHSIGWIFMVMLPIAAYLGFTTNSSFMIIFCLNTIIHGLVDDLKANRKAINLIQDQMFHITQIVATFITFI